MRLPAITAALLLTACASTPPMGNVIPRPDNQYEAVAIGESKDSAMESALFTAESTCKNRNMRHVVLGQSVQYRGVVSEGLNKSVNQFGAIVTRASGRITPSLSSDDDYQLTLQFRCES